MSILILLLHFTMLFAAVNIVVLGMKFNLRVDVLGGGVPVRKKHGINV